MFLEPCCLVFGIVGCGQHCLGSTSTAMYGIRREAVQDADRHIDLEVYLHVMLNTRANQWCSAGHILGAAAVTDPCK